MSEQSSSKEFRSIKRVASVLRIVAASGEAGVSLATIAKSAELSKATAHRFVCALEREELIERDAVTRQCRMRPGLAFGPRSESSVPVKPKPDATRAGGTPNISAPIA